MKPAILKAMLSELDADLQGILPDTDANDFENSFTLLCMIQIMRNTRNVSKPVITTGLKTEIGTILCSYPGCGRIPEASRYQCAEHDK